jgi:hypothetical protein
MSTTRLTSFKIHGRASFGAVIDAGMVDLGGRLGGRYPSLLALIRAGEVGTVRLTDDPSCEPPPPQKSVLLIGRLEKL